MKSICFTCSGNPLFLHFLHFSNVSHQPGEPLIMSRWNVRGADIFIVMIISLTLNEQTHGNSTCLLPRHLICHYTQPVRSTLHHPLIFYLWKQWLGCVCVIRQRNKTRINHPKWFIFFCNNKEFFTVLRTARHNVVLWVLQILKYIQIIWHPVGG